MELAQSNGGVADQFDKAHLTDVHALPQYDIPLPEVGDLESDLVVRAVVHERCGDMNCDEGPTKSAATLDQTHERGLTFLGVRRKRDALCRHRKYTVTGPQDEAVLVIEHHNVTVGCQHRRDLLVGGVERDPTAVAIAQEADAVHHEVEESRAPAADDLELGAQGQVDGIRLETGVLSGSSEFRLRRDGESSGFDCSNDLLIAECSHSATLSSG